MRCYVCNRRLVNEVKDELHEATKSENPELCQHDYEDPKVRINLVQSMRRG